MNVKLVCHIVVNSNGKIASYTSFTNAVDSFLACHKHPYKSKTDITEIKHVISYMNMLHGLDISVDKHSQNIYIQLIMDYKLKLVLIDI